MDNPFDWKLSASLARQHYSHRCLYILLASHHFISLYVVLTKMNHLRYNMCVTHKSTLGRASAHTYLSLGIKHIQLLYPTTHITHVHTQQTLPSIPNEILKRNISMNKKNSIKNTSTLVPKTISNIFPWPIFFSCVCLHSSSFCSSSLACVRLLTAAAAVQLNSFRVGILIHNTIRGACLSFFYNCCC